MDLLKVIQDLREERERLDLAIHSFESVLTAGHGGLSPRPPAGRRGRKKGMSEKERQEVSQRMREYWARRRREKLVAAKAGRPPRPQQG